MRSVLIQDKRIVDYLAKYYDKIDEILQVIATPPALTTLRINTNLVRGPAEKAKLIDELKAQLPPGAFEIIESPAGLPNTLGIYHRPDTQSEAVLTEPRHPLVVVDARCGESVLRGADVFAPGVVSVSKGILSGNTVSVIVDVCGTLRHGEDPARLTSGGSPLLSPEEKTAVIAYVGDGVAQFSRNDMLSATEGVSVQITRRIGTSTAVMPSLNGILSNKIFLQNVSSMVAALALSPAAGARVLDMCAAPGGKTTHIAELIGNIGDVLAVDRSKARAEELRKLCERMGATCVHVVAADSKSLRKICPDDGAFDSVLLDAPCSGVGLRPRLVEKSSFEDFAARGPYQRKLFREAHRLLRPGGTLVFSTCTLNPDEGEAVVAFAVEEFPDLVLVKVLPDMVRADLLGEQGVAGAGLSDEQRKLVRRFVPRSECDNIVQDTSAFFVAKFVKKCEGIDKVK